VGACLEEEWSQSRLVGTTQFQNDSGSFSPIDASGNLFGDNEIGGATFGGTVFELTR
jgi:hypothetical protein